MKITIKKKVINLRIITNIFQLQDKINKELKSERKLEDAAKETSNRYMRNKIKETFKRTIFISFSQFLSGEYNLRTPLPGMQSPIFPSSFQ